MKTDSLTLSLITAVFVIATLSWVSITLTPIVHDAIESWTIDQVVMSEGR